MRKGEALALHWHDVHLNEGVLYVRYTLSLARLGEFPVGVFSADWTLLSWTPAWAVLLGDPSGRTHAERNLVRAVFASGPEGSPPGPCNRTATP
ncbi:hypothetical protein [Streptomyces sp. RTd22]|uniref:MmyB family transcriptional regulator n=1 Tax=Streptomyces sp. RTd22 TaxID=1841249 RepID=UPI000A8FB247